MENFSQLNNSAISKVEDPVFIIAQTSSGSWLSNLPVEPISIGQAPVIILSCGLATNMIIRAVSQLLIARKLN